MKELIKYSKEWLEHTCANSYSYAEVLRKAGRKCGGGSVQTLKHKISEYQIDISHFTGQGWNGHSNTTNPIQTREKYSLNDIFCEHSSVTQKVMRGYIKRYQLLDYKCSNCGCDGHWQNGLISLEVDHINGDNSDNILENLRYLCPNCHALTNTYRSRNKALKSMCREYIPTT